VQPTGLCGRRDAGRRPQVAQGLFQVQPVQQAVRLGQRERPRPGPLLQAMLRQKVRPQRIRIRRWRGRPVHGYRRASWQQVLRDGQQAQRRQRLTLYCVFPLNPRPLSHQNTHSITTLSLSTPNL